MQKINRISTASFEYLDIVTFETFQQKFAKTR